MREGRPHIVDMIKNDEHLADRQHDRRQAGDPRFALDPREAVHHRITYYTTLAAALASCEALDHMDEVDVNRLQDLHQELLA